MNPISNQPVPLQCNVSKTHEVTAIARTWAQGDTERCRLCATCTAGGGLCVVTTTEAIDHEDAWLFRLRGPAEGGVSPGALRLASR